MNAGAHQCAPYGEHADRHACCRVVINGDRPAQHGAHAGRHARCRVAINGDRPARRALICTLRNR